MRNGFLYKQNAGELHNNNFETDSPIVMEFAFPLRGQTPRQLRLAAQIVVKLT
jgi:hypothetical protein